jgi:hypothetical protein
MSERFGEGVNEAHREEPLTDSVEAHTRELNQRYGGVEAVTNAKQVEERKQEDESIIAKLRKFFTKGAGR